MNSKLLIAVALMVIGIGGYGLLTPSAPIASAPTEDATPNTPIKQYQVWLAKEPLQKGQLVSRTDLELRRIDEAQALSLGVNQDIELTFVADLRIERDLAAGEVVWPEWLITPEQPAYLDLILTPNHVPFAIQVNPQSVIGGVIRPGTLVDILALSSLKQNLATDETVRSFETVSLTPVLMGVKVLQVNQQSSHSSSGRNEELTSQANVIVELTRKQVATLTIARHIAQLEIHLSAGNSLASDLSANAGDVLTDYKAIQEFRAGSATTR
ncbi:Flp pilus assembly protein CpaB [Vibrio navarrensis]|uniref:Flp pilus assembly protein CpaB n=1 Tax=Vibrio navarrensis TaxID=29495 RepID=UPI00192F393C|nr:Flp pilus assembly protein CpaB [Vibrio navarrensis]MBE3667485.1 Flp pilus assembly protein CpaB [Vibrio navarrensis]